MMWVDLFLQVLVQALAWCVAVTVTVAPAAYVVLVSFHRWRRASRAAAK